MDYGPHGDCFPRELAAEIERNLFTAVKLLLEAGLISRDRACELSRCDDEDLDMYLSRGN